jgi:hypothetical protein
MPYGEPLSTLLLLMFSLVMGLGLRYFLPSLHEYTVSWVALTFITLTIPLLSAFVKIIRENRNVMRNSLTVTQRLFVIPEEEAHARIPKSYRRFLWFILALALSFTTLLAGGAYSYRFLSTLPHSGLDAIVYVYSWIAIVYSMDFIVESIIDLKVRCHPLSGVLRLYFYMLYFIFYRNLFARLRDEKQFLLIQAASSLWVMTFYPLRMSKPFHQFMANYFGVTPNYESYQRLVGQVFFTRNIAENASMLGFLLWLNIISFGPNLAVYPYFRFQDHPGDPYTYELTMWCSLVVWFSELFGGYIVRTIFKRYYGHSITREAVYAFQRFPEGIPATVVVVVWVLMSMLFALLGIRFAPLV